MAKTSCLYLHKSVVPLLCVIYSYLLNRSRSFVEWKQAETNRAFSTKRSRPHKCRTPFGPGTLFSRSLDCVRPGSVCELTCAHSRHDARPELFFWPAHPGVPAWARRVFVLRNGLQRTEVETQLFVNSPAIFCAIATCTEEEKGKRWAYQSNKQQRWSLHKSCSETPLERYLDTGGACIRISVLASRAAQIYHAGQKRIISHAKGGG